MRFFQSSWSLLLLPRTVYVYVRVINDKHRSVRKVEFCAFVFPILRNNATLVTFFNQSCEINGHAISTVRHVNTRMVTIKCQYLFCNRHGHYSTVFWQHCHCQRHRLMPLAMITLRGKILCYRQLGGFSSQQHDPVSLLSDQYGQRYRNTVNILHKWTCIQLRD